MRVAIVTEATDQDDWQAAACVLFAIDCAWLAAHPEAPNLYASGVRYRAEPRGCDDTVCREERFESVPIVLARGWGDCDDLAAWRAAEAMVREGRGARPLVLHVSSAPGVRRWHVVVEYDDGTREDPCLVLGMGRVA